MKKFAPFPYLLLFLLSGLVGWTQDCSSYLFLQQGKTIEVTIYNKKGEVAGKNVFTVSNVSNSGGVTTGTLNTQSFNKKDQPTSSSSNTIKCTGGVLQIDMKLMLPDGPPGRFSNAQVSGNGGILEYPSGMKTGDTLKSGNMVLNTNNSNGGPGGPPGTPPGPPPPPNPFGGSSTLTMWVYDRKVLGQEPVTTTAGTWSCIKISFKSKVSFKTGPFPTNINIEGTEWYAPGVGIIKTQSEHGATAITSVK
jgi:hypothetical protein